MTRFSHLKKELILMRKMICSNTSDLRASKKGAGRKVSLTGRGDVPHHSHGFYLHPGAPGQCCHLTDKTS